MVDGVEWSTNPRHALDWSWHEFVRLWAACRGDMGVAHWPDAGGIAAQAAWIVEAFGVLNAAAARKEGEPAT